MKAFKELGEDLTTNINGNWEENNRISDEKEVNTRKRNMNAMKQEMRQEINEMKK